MTVQKTVVTKVAGNIGAEIRGVDISQPLPASTIDEIRAALMAHRVVFFRQQSLTVAQHKRFASYFGHITMAHPMLKSRDADELVVRDLNYSKEAVTSGLWHTDVPFVLRPPAMSILRSLTIPECGGDTLWANTVRAYDMLPPELRGIADQLWAVHVPVSNSYDTAPFDVSPEIYSQPGVAVTRHPVVQVHPETGERALLLGDSIRSFDGWSEGDSRDLLRVFQSYVTRPENTVRWMWQVGDVAFWDNRSTQHYAITDYGDAPRHLQRITVGGDIPISPSGERSIAMLGDDAEYHSAANGKTANHEGDVSPESK